MAKLRAEVELLQLEHDASKALLAERFKSVVVANAETIGEIDEFKIVSYYMRMGAEKVGKAAELDKAIEDDRAAMEKAIEKAREIPDGAQTQESGVPPAQHRAESEEDRAGGDGDQARRIDVKSYRIPRPGGPQCPRAPGGACNRHRARPSEESSRDSALRGMPAYQLSTESRRRAPLQSSFTRAIRTGRERP